MPAVAAEVDRGDLVVAAAATGRRARSGGTTPPRSSITTATAMPIFQRPDVRRRAREREHDEDLVRGVGDRREGVAGEDGEGDALGEKRLAQLGAAQLAAEQDPLGDVADAHERGDRRHERTSTVHVHVVIMGCGRVGSTLARSLEDRNHTVSIIDSDPDAFRRLGPGLQRRQGDRLRLRAGRPGEGRHPACGRLRRRLAAATTPTSSPRVWRARPSASSRSWPGSTTPAAPRSTSGSASRRSRP